MIMYGGNESDPTSKMKRWRIGYMSLLIKVFWFVTKFIVMDVCVVGRICQHCPPNWKCSRPILPIPNPSSS